MIMITTRRLFFQSFSLMYALGKDTELAYHYDNAEITFNICLGNKFCWETCLLENMFCWEACIVGKHAWLRKMFRF